MAITSLSVDFKVTDLNMDRLAKLRQDLQERFEQTNNRVQYRDHFIIFFIINYEIHKKININRY